MTLFHLRLGPHRGLYPSDFPTTTLSRENFVAKKEHMSSKVSMVQLAHKDIHSIFTNLSASSVPHSVHTRECSVHTTKNTHFFRTNVKLRNEIRFYSK
jgi:hypothetical protein